MVKAVQFRLVYYRKKKKLNSISLSGSNSTFSNTNKYILLLDKVEYHV